MSNGSISTALEGEQSVLILLPVNPRFDEVAAGLALYLALNQTGKKTSISSPTDMRVEFNRLVGVNRITTEFGGNNLLITFRNYKADDIEKVSWDLRDGEFQLSVIPKASAKPPTKDQINLSYAGFSGGAVILVGGANESHFPDLSKDELKNGKLIHVGVKELQTNKQLISFDRPASSVSEIAAYLIKDMGVAFDADIATNLLMGIEEGTGNFEAPQVNADTFYIFAELLKSGGSRAPKLGRSPFEGDQQPTVMRSDQGSQEQTKSLPPIRINTEETQSQQAGEQQVKSREEDQQRDENDTKPPKSWFEPKIYKGTSV